MKVPPDERAKFKLEAMNRIAHSEENEWHKYLLCECVDSYMPLERPELEEFENLLLTPESREASKMIRSIFDRARAEGMEKGMENGLQALVEHRLHRRFGPLSVAARDRIQQMSSEELFRLSDAMDTASSMGELGLEN